MKPFTGAPWKTPTLLDHKAENEGPRKPADWFIRYQRMNGADVSKHWSGKHYSDEKDSKYEPCDLNPGVAYNKRTQKCTHPRSVTLGARGPCHERRNHSLTNACRLQGRCFSSPTAWQPRRAVFSQRAKACRHILDTTTCKAVGRREWQEYHCRAGTKGRPGLLFCQMGARTILPRPRRTVRSKPCCLPRALTPLGALS